MDAGRQSSSFEPLHRSHRTVEPIELGRIGPRGVPPSRAIGLEKQQSNDSKPGKHTKPGKRTNGLGENLIAIFLWVLFAAATTASWVLQYTLQPNEAAEYGFKTMASDTCERFKLRTNTTGMYLFALNITTAVVAFIASYFRAGLLAPNPDKYLESNGSLYLGVESVRGFRQASWYRKFMYGVLLLASLPLYYL